MIRKFIALFVALLALSLLTVLIVFGLLHTQYAKPMITQTLHSVFDIQISSESIQYHYPNQLTFRNTHFDVPGVAPFRANKLALWIGFAPSVSAPVTIDELLIDGTTINDTSGAQNWLQRWPIRNLALDHVDYSDSNVIINDLRLQVRDLRASHSIMDSKGTFQLEASQLYYKGSAIDDLFLDGVIDGSDSKLYSASFRWNNAKISTQAQLEEGKWSLVNATVNQLDYDFTQQDDRLLELTHQLIGHINSLDILNSTLKYQDTVLENVSASIENIHPGQPIWAQNQAYISVDADQLVWQGLAFVEPTAELYISEDTIELRDLDTNLEQGRIQLSGELTANEINLKSVMIDGLKLYQEQQQPSLLALMQQINFEDIKHISIDKLNINRTQWIQLVNKPFWQITGFNLEASHLVLKDNYQWGLWHGKAIASANSASIDSILANQLLLDTESSEGKWQLNKLFVPFSDGYLSATAALDFTAPSQPFTLQAKAFSLPVALTNLVTSDDTLKITGLADLNLSISALIADKVALSQTLSGELTATLYDTSLQTQRDDSVNKLEVSPIELSADRGIIALAPFSVAGDTIQGNAEAVVDMRTQSLSDAVLILQEECSVSYNIELLTGRVTSSKMAPCIK